VRKIDKGEIKATINLLDKEEPGQGILLYYDNRLIRRYENPKLGNLDFISYKYVSEELGESGLFETNGYIELKAPFKPNITKTVSIKICSKIMMK